MPYDIPPLPVISIHPDQFAQAREMANRDKAEALKAVARHFELPFDPIILFRTCASVHNGPAHAMVDEVAKTWKTRDFPDYIIITLMRIRHLQVSTP